MNPLGELTIATHGRRGHVSGSVAVRDEGPVGGVLRFDIPRLGVAGVGDSPPVRDALFPVRHRTDGVNTGVALQNPGEARLLVCCRLMGDGGTAKQAQIYTPWSVAVDGAGNLYIADTDNNRIRA